MELYKSLGNKIDGLQGAQMAFNSQKNGDYVELQVIISTYMHANVYVKTRAYIHEYVHNT